jgi:hypothetical protein
MTLRATEGLGCLLICSALILGFSGCDTPDPTRTPSGSERPAPAGGTDGGTDDGTDGGTDAPPDGGDGGTDTPPDGGDDGPPDGGEEPPPDDRVSPEVPTLEGWTFYTREDGAPADVRGVAMDRGGNVWVAGGKEGLFLLRPGATSFERFGRADGLRPYGYMEDGSAPPGAENIALEVISVEGGPAGTVWVGYAGHPRCEFNYDTPEEDPAIYKSGDADRVELNADGTLSVVHYDIFSGPGVVGGYHRSREKLCHVLRMAWDPSTDSIWFGANHGFARGEAGFAGNPTCNGQLSCTGVLEHAHPHIAARNGDDQIVILTDAYYGVAPAPNGDVWFGGANRSTRFRYMSNSRRPGDYFRAAYETEAPEFAWNRLDLWPDAVDETGYPAPHERTDDLVSAMVAMPDDTVWVASFAWGLVRLNSSGDVVGHALSGAANRNVSALARDPSDGGLWAGHRYGGGLTRIRGGSTVSLWDALGDLGNHPVLDLEAVQVEGQRNLWVAFGPYEERAGVLGVYRGP